MTKKIRNAAIVGLLALGAAESGNMRTLSIGSQIAHFGKVCLRH